MIERENVIASNLQRIIRFTCPQWWWLPAFAGLGVVGLWIGRFVDLSFLVGLVLMQAGWHLVGRGDEVTSWPLSFGLPGYRKPLRVRNLLEGAVSGLGITFLLVAPWGQRGAEVEFSFEPTPVLLECGTPLARALATIVLALGMVVTHMLSRVLEHAGSRWGGVGGLAWILLCFLALFGSSAVDRCPVLMWLVLLAMELALLVLLWIRLGDERLVRDGHRRQIQKTLAPCPRIRVQEQSRESQLEAFFRRRMEREAFLGVRRYRWGELGRALIPLLYYWRMELVCLAGSALILGFLGDVFTGQVFVLFGLFVLALHLPIAPEETLLLPVGPKERCAATIAIAAGASSIFLAFGVVVIAISWLLWLAISLSPLERLTSMTFLKIDPRWFYWPCLMVPWAVASRSLWGWMRRVVQACTAVALVSLIAGVYLFHYDMISVGKLHAFCVCVLAAGWLLLLLTLRYLAGRGSLVTWSPPGEVVA